MTSREAKCNQQYRQFYQLSSTLGRLLTITTYVKMPHECTDDSAITSSTGYLLLAQHLAFLLEIRNLSKLDLKHSINRSIRVSVLHASN